MPVHAAAALLVAHGVTGAPVVDAGHPMIGMATEADLVRMIVPMTGTSANRRSRPSARS
jgi:predicted transcriptional regulator